MAGIPENVAMEISGHHSRSVFDRYSIMGGRDIREAAEKMEERLRSSLGRSPARAHVWAHQPIQTRPTQTESGKKLLLTR